MPGQKLTTSAEHGRAVRARYVAALVVVLAGVFWWLSQLPETQPIRTEAESRAAHPSIESATASATLARDSLGQIHDRQPATVDGQPNASDEWTVQLVGLKPNAPWTAPLHLIIEGRIEIKAAVDADGACTFVPPAAAHQVGLQHMRIMSRDPNYLILKQHYRTAPLQRTGLLRVHVAAVGTLRGRVINPHGVGIVARVCAYREERMEYRSPLLARTESDSDGYYELQVVPGVRVHLVAEAMQAKTSPLRDINQGTFSFARIAPQSPSQLEDLQYHDPRERRPEWLPASMLAEAVFRTTQPLADLQLGLACLITGRIEFADGTPLKNATVAAVPTRAKPQHSFSVGRHPPPIAAAQARSNQAGEFTLHVAPGESFRILADCDMPFLNDGQLTATVTAPGRVHLKVPGRMHTLRVTKNGKPLPNASVSVLIPNLSPYPTNSHGEVHVALSAAANFLQATHEASTSEWLELPAGPRPDTIELRVQDAAVTPVRITLRSKPPVRNAMFLFVPTGNGRPITLTASRPNGETPFALQVPTGEYELTIRDIDRAPGGAFMLPGKHMVAITPAGFVATYDTTFGGRISVDLHAKSGIRVGGRFTLTNANGVDVTPAAIAWDTAGIVHTGELGQLQAMSRNRFAQVLPAGNYTLSVTTITRGSVTLPVTVEAQRNTNVPIVLR